MNLTTLRNELGNLLKATAISNTRKDRWLNLSQDDVAASIHCSHLNVEFEFDTVDGTRTYYVPFEFRKISSVIDVDNDIELDEATETELEEIDPDRSDTGSSYIYCLHGLSWVAAQPSSSSVISVVSSSASDTTQTVRINGLNSSDVEVTDSVTLTGLTAASSTVSFKEIRQIVKSATTAGYVTATSNSGAVTNVIIPADMLAKQYQPISLYPYPDDAYTYRVRGIRRPKQMINTTDFPDFPEAYHELVLIGAVIRGHEDRFRPTLAKHIKDTFWTPKIKELREKMGGSAGKESIVIGEVVNWNGVGRLPSNYPL